MFKFAGKEAIDGAVARAGELLSGLDASKVNDGLSKMAEKIPVLGILVKGYNSMTPEEQGEFAKNLMIAGAKLAAKSV
jgi:hypothetical protein